MQRKHNDGLHMFSFFLLPFIWLLFMAKSMPQTCMRCSSCHITTVSQHICFLLTSQKTHLTCCLPYYIWCLYVSLTLQSILNTSLSICLKLQSTKTQYIWLILHFDSLQSVCVALFLKNWVMVASLYFPHFTIIVQYIGYLFIDLQLRFKTSAHISHYSWNSIVYKSLLYHKLPS